MDESVVLMRTVPTITVSVCDKGALELPAQLRQTDPLIRIWRPAVQVAVVLRGVAVDQMFPFVVSSRIRTFPPCSSTGPSNAHLTEQW